MNLMVVGAYEKGKTSLLQQLVRWGTCPKEKTVNTEKIRKIRTAEKISVIM